ncbi:multidrug ABC transporter ATP-binding protein [Clostridia bacterium]|nr:multidrug ABC transporter ATP-binding protein [Clostridia bacterium]
MIKLLRYLKPYRARALLAPFAKLIETVSELLMPLVMAALIDNGIANKDPRYVWICAGIMAFLALFGFSACMVCQYLASVASMGMGAGIRRALHRKADTLTAGDLEKFGASSLVTRSVNDVAQVQTAVAMFIRLILRAPLLAIGGIVMLLVLDARLALISAIFVPLFALALWLVLKKSLPAYRTAQTQLDGVSRSIAENLNGVRAVRAFNRTEYERERFSGLNARYRRSATRAALYAALLSPLTQLIMNLAIVAVLWYSGFNPAAGAISAGNLIAFINYLTQIMFALNIAANLAPSFLRAASSAARINEVLETAPAFGAPANGVREGAPDAPALEFRGVCFSYGDGRGAVPESYVLNDINFRLEKGGVLGIIGGTGAGKSTLAALILRLYDCAAGEVLVDGVPVGDYDPQALRDKIGYVPQKAALFSGTVAENLRVGKEDATEEEMRAACELAQSWEFVSRIGFDARIEQGGKNLSGGQKQRLTIARALVRRPAILILDDSASALDYVTDYRLRSALKTMNGMTVVIVSQRVASIREAGRILVLDNGKAAGLGTHGELLRSCPLYEEICASQQLE